MLANDMLLYLSIHHKGDWNSIYDDIKNKRKYFTEEDVKKVKESVKSKYVTLIDKDYPNCFKQVFQPPFVIYYYGDLHLLDDYSKNVAVIGSRVPSRYGEEMTEKIVSEICEKVTVVSGLARGIDSLSHETAINNGGKTIAIIGSGIDNCYPKESLDLYNEIKKNHLLISEYPGNSAPDAKHFPLRNRLIAGSSSAVVVTDASIRSGTSITVNYALQTGKYVCAVPFHADENTLCNRLIKDGAKFCECGQDVLDEMNYQE